MSLKVLNGVTLLDYNYNNLPCHIYFATLHKLIYRRIICMASKQPKTVRQHNGNVAEVID